VWEVLFELKQCLTVAEGLAEPIPPPMLKGVEWVGAIFAALKRCATPKSKCNRGPGWGTRPSPHERFLGYYVRFTDLQIPK
jgi:hypothetical protein